MANRPTPLIPDDPLFNQQWHLLNTGQVSGAIAGFDTNVTKVWPDYTGRGILVAALDDGFDQTHPDLAANYRADLSWDFALNQLGASPANLDDDHGTAVAGLVVSVANNGIGGTGSAWGANLVGYRMGLDEGTSIDQIASYFNGAALRIIQNGASVFTNSWGVMGYPFDTQSLQSQFSNTARSLATEGRGGLGVTTLFAAGNDGDLGFNANYDPTDNIPFTVVVAASRSNGQITDYSTPGASVMVAAPGSDPASIVTTDRQSTLGYNTLYGEAGNYTNTHSSYFNGTSAATPIAAGVVALILQANPNLGYRDIQEILVYSSKRAVFLDQPDVETTVNDATDWNGGGLLTGYDFGYGNIDALAAVRLAESWQKQSTASNLQIVGGTVQQHHLSLGAGGTASATASFASHNRVEQVTVTLDLNTQRLQDVRVELIAPNGTTSVLVDYPPAIDSNGDPADLPTHLAYTLNTVRDWGETLTGDWTLRVTNKNTGTPVTLNDWSIQAYTAATTTDHAQIFTDEFSTFATRDAGRLILSSAHGNEINAAAVSAASTLDLSGGLSHIGSTAVSLLDPHAFTKIISGDGNDMLIGNALDNLLMGGRGNNVLDGGAGMDTAQYMGGRSMYDVVQNVTGGYRVVSHELSGGGTDVLTQIETLRFGTTALLARSALDQTETVGGFYDVMFDRAPDAGGLKYWTNSILDAGSSELAVAQAFTQATEDGANQLTNTEFVTLMYQNAFDRVPDQAGLNFWVGLLDAHQLDRGSVLLGFVDSPEFTNNELDMIAVRIANLGDIWV